MKCYLYLFVILLLVAPVFGQIELFEAEADDSDGDSVLNVNDGCPNSFFGELTDETGCTARQWRKFAVDAIPPDFLERQERAAMDRYRSALESSLSPAKYAADHSFLKCGGEKVFNTDASAFRDLEKFLCTKTKYSPPFQDRPSEGMRSIPRKDLAIAKTRRAGSIMIGNSKDVHYYGCGLPLQEGIKESIRYTMKSQQQLARTAISYSFCDPETLDGARQEIDKGNLDLSQDRFDQAAIHFGLAWKKANSCVCPNENAWNVRLLGNRFLDFVREFTGQGFKH